MMSRDDAYNGFVDPTRRWVSCGGGYELEVSRVKVYASQDTSTALIWLTSPISGVDEKRLSRIHTDHISWNEGAFPITSHNGQ